MRKRILSVILLICMLVNNLPVAAFAEGTDSGCNHVCDSSCGYVAAVDCDKDCQPAEEGGEIVHVYGCAYNAGSLCSHKHNGDCGVECSHVYAEGICAICGEPQPCEHIGGTATCTALAVCATCDKGYGDLADHTYSQGTCSVCGEVCEHSYTEGVCTDCGMAEPVPTCDCTVKCAEGAVNENCQVCKTDLTQCGYTESAPTCDCTVKCADTVSETCPVCSADGADLINCIGKEPETEAPVVTVSQWEWVDQEEIYNTDRAVAELAGVGSWEQVQVMLPAAILVNGEEVVLTWEKGDFDEIPGTYTLTATLPEGYVLADGSTTLTLTLEMGLDSTGYDTEPHEHAPCIGGVCSDNGHTSITWNPYDSKTPSSGNYYLTEDKTETSYLYIKEGRTVYLCLNGFKLTCTMVDISGTLILCDCSDGGTGELITTDSGVSVYDTFTMNSGIITAGDIGVKYAANWGATCTAKFTMNGGTINAKNNKGVSVGSNRPFTMNGGKITGKSSSDGGGVYVPAGAIFTMNGGEISGCTAGDKGGGVYVGAGGNFTMNGGEISGCTAGDKGGGIYAHGGDNPTVTITGGEISGNTATANGGGIYVAGLNNVAAKLTLSGNVIIEENTAGGNGGGVYAETTTLKIQGNCRITGNTADGNGGGVYQRVNGSIGRSSMSGGEITNNIGGGLYLYSEWGCDDTFDLSGSPKIQGNTAAGAPRNLYLSKTKIKVSSALTEGTSIGLSGEEYNGALSADNHGDYVKFFKSEQPGKKITTNGNGAFKFTTDDNVPTGITLNLTGLPTDGEGNPYLSLEKGGTATLSATVIGNEGCQDFVTWSSSDTSVATVNESGKVTAVGPGTAIITAKTVNALEATCKVTVAATSYSVTLTEGVTLVVDRSEVTSGGKIVPGKTVTIVPVLTEGKAVDEITVTKTDNTGTVEVKKGTGDNEYTFTMPDSAVTVNVTFRDIVEYNLWVGGVQVTDLNKDDIDEAIKKADSMATVSGNASYNPETNTLTLDGFTYTGTGYQDAAIYALNTDLNVYLVGTNTICCADGFAIKVDNNGPDITLKIYGSDKATAKLVCESTVAIYVNNALVIENATVSGTGSGTITAQRSVTITNSAVSIAGKLDAGESGTNLRITNSTVNVTGIVACYLSITGSNITASNTAGKGIHAYGSLSITNSTVQARGTDSAIYAPTITIDPNSEVIAGDSDTNAAYVPVPDEDTYKNKYVKIAPLSPHIHCVCGSTTCSGDGHDPTQEWIKWTGEPGDNTITFDGGYYYLPAYFPWDCENWSGNDNVHICMNGQTGANDKNSFNLTGTFTLTTCNSSVPLKRNVNLNKNSVLNLYNVQVDGNGRTNTKEVINLPASGATFNMHSGFVKSGYVSGSSSNFFMHRGEITDVTVDYNGTFTMSGGSVSSVNVRNHPSGNYHCTFNMAGGQVGQVTIGTSKASLSISRGSITNLSLPDGFTFSVTDNFTDSDKIGITATKPAAGGRTVIGTSDTDTSGYFCSNDKGYVIDYDNGELYLRAAKPVESVTLNPNTLSLTVGQTSELTATVDPAGADNAAVTWSSSAPAVATVDSTGKVTALAEGTANITATAGGKSATCTVTVVKATIIPAVSITGWTYGESAKQPSVTGNTGNGTVTYTYKVMDASDDTYSETVPTNAGTYTVKAEIAATGAYSSGTAIANFTINKAPLTVTATDKTITYGDEAPNNEVTCTGFVGTESTDNLEGTLTFSCNYQKGNNVGTYTITPAGYTSDNYEIIFESGTLTVVAKDVTITAAPKSKVYGEPDPELTYTVSGLVSDDTVADVNLTRVPGSAVGAYAIELKTATVSDNYTIKYVSADLTITKAPLSVTANNNAITYGDAPAGNGVKYEGFVNGEDESVLSGTLGYAYSYTQYGDVGEYTITPKDLTSDNYNITFNQGKLIVGQKKITVTAEDQAITYGDEFQQEAIAAVLAGNDKLDSVIVTADKTVCPGGVLTASAAIIKNGEKDVTANYDITYETGELTVNKATPTINWATKEFTYDKQSHGEATVTLVNGESYTGTVTYTYGGKSGLPTDAGTYTVSASVSEQANYKAASATEAVTIKPKSVTPTVTLTPEIFTYDGEAKESVVVVKDGNDVLSDTEYSVAYASNVSVGAGNVCITDKTGGNYAVATANVKFLILPDTSALEDVTTENVTSANSAAIDAIQAAMADKDITGVSKEAKDAWDALAARCTDLEKAIADAAKRSENITKDAATLPEDIKTSDLNKINEILNQYADIEDNLTAEQKAELADEIRELEKQKAAIEKTNADLKSVDDGTKALDNKTDLVYADKANIKALEDKIADIEKNNPYLSESDKQNLQTQKNTLETLKDEFAAADKVTEKVNALNTKAEPDDANAVNAYETAKKDYAMLSDSDKAKVDPNAPKRLEEMKAALTAYKIIKGDGTKHQLGSSQGLTIVSNGYYPHFRYVKVNGQEISSSNYTSASGSTIVTLKPEYVNRLMTGKYTITIGFGDEDYIGEATANVQLYTDSGLPFTGDTIAMWIAMMAVSAGALIVVLVFAKKKFSNKK